MICKTNFLVSVDEFCFAVYEKIRCTASVLGFLGGLSIMDSHSLSLLASFVG